MTRTIRRTLHRTLTILSLLALALALAGIAYAYTPNQATTKARAEQHFDCKWGSLIVYRCANPYAILPQCITTGIDRPGQPQYLCAGMFQRQNRILGTWQRCTTIYQLTPWGRTLNHRTYTCHR